MVETLKVGIVGANWTLFHAAAWRNVPGVEVAAICTAHQETAEAAAAENGIPNAYWRLEDMLANPELSIINVGTRPSQRYDMVMAALAAGKHVYNCLPFATDAARATQMHELQRARGLVGAVDAQWRWTPAIRRMKELIEEGAIGEFFTATIHLQLALYDYDDLIYTQCTLSGTTKPYHWLTQSASGASAWRNFGSHTILNLMYLFGEIEEIVGTTNTFVKELRFPDGTEIRPDTDDFRPGIAAFPQWRAGQHQCQLGDGRRARLFPGSVRQQGQAGRARRRFLRFDDNAVLWRHPPRRTGRPRRTARPSFRCRGHDVLQAERANLHRAADRPARRHGARHPHRRRRGLAFFRRSRPRAPRRGGRNSVESPKIMGPRR
ncbi:MAG: Gfo/Idh/MocA family oxidoreductase [Rhodospirillales bacterium]